MNDLLSAASLLLAVVGIFYGLWYPEIIKALDEPIPVHMEDKRLPYKRVSTTLLSKAVPLLISALLVALIFFPDMVKIFIASFVALRTLGIAEYLAAYDAVKTAFCTVEILAIAISIHAFMMLIKLIVFRRKLI